VYDYCMKRTLVLTMACLLMASPAAGQSAATLVHQIDSLYHASAHWSVDFEQQVHYPVFNETDQETGTLSVGPSGKFRLSTDRHIVTSDGDTLWTHNIRANQVTVDRVDATDEVIRPADFLFHFKEDYDVSACDSDGPGTCLYLKTRDESAFIREMWLWADPATSHVKRAVYKDINLNETTFTFVKIDFSFKPSKKEFSYDPPPGVEVIRLP
jgi:outer membrane lipoprotein-sorting protein